MFNFSRVGSLGLGCITAVCTALYIIRFYFMGKDCKCEKKYTINDFIIITGSSAGIGLETAIEVAKRGARVILACKDIHKAKLAKNKIISKTRNSNITVLKLDLASFNSIRNFVCEVNKTLAGNPLTALVNNAGIFYSPHIITEDGFDITFQTNYLGPFLLTNLLLPLLHKAPGGRIVNVSSAAHAVPNSLDVQHLNIVNEKEFDRFHAYQISKLCLVVFTHKLEDLSRNKFTQVYAVDPGNVETSIYRNFPPLANRFCFALQKPVRFFTVKTPSEGCQGILHALLSPHAGFYIQDIETTNNYTHLLTDNTIVENLYNKSKIWVGLN